MNMTYEQIEALPIAQKALIRAKEWEVSPQFAKRFLTLEAEVFAERRKALAAELSKKA